MYNKILIETGNLKIHQLLKADSVQVLQFITGTILMMEFKLLKNWICMELVLDLRSPVRKSN